MERTRKEISINVHTVDLPLQSKSHQWNESGQDLLPLGGDMKGGSMMMA